MAAIHYSLTARRPESHIYNVTCRVDSPDPNGQEVSIPAWIPGSYLVRDFSRHVLSCAAKTVSGESLPVNKLDKSTWKAGPTTESIVFEYEVYAHDLSVRGAHLDTSHGFFNGTSVFFLVHGQENDPVTVSLERPAGQSAWRVATTLPRVSGSEYEFGEFTAANYDELIDHPVEMGDFQLVEFEACGVPHALVFTGRCTFDGERLQRDLKRLCETQIRFFGEPAPMDRYLFLTTVLGNGYGGLEHRSSTALMCSRDDLPQSYHEGVTENYRRFLGLCSHEYFHTWNVKRIKPAAFCPYTLGDESYTDLLWVFEGITSYYDDLMLVRSGLISPNSYLQLLEKTISRVTAIPGRFRQSLAQSSFDAWIKLYKPDENSVNAGISYYTKGSLLALALDLKIREDSDNKLSLDDVMRESWRRYGTTGMPESAFEQMVMEITGLDLQGFFESGVRGTDDIDLATGFTSMGVSFELRQEKTKPNHVPSDMPSMGLNLRFTGEVATAVSVLEGGPAQNAGVSPGDELVALDGLKVTRESFAKVLRNYTVGTEVKLTCFRRDELMHFDIVLASAPKTVCCLAFDGQASADTLAKQAVWLNSE